MWYGPADGGVSTPFGLCARFVGTAQKNGIATRASKSGAGFVRWTIRWFPLTTTPETGDFDDPTTSWKKDRDGDWIFRSASRSNAALKFATVTGRPFENFVKPALTMKSYVFPLFDTFGKPAAASGTS